MTRKTTTRRASKPKSKPPKTASHLDLQIDATVAQRARADAAEGALADLQADVVQLLAVNSEQCARIARQDMEINGLRAKLCKLADTVLAEAAAKDAKVAP